METPPKNDDFKDDRVTWLDTFCDLARAISIEQHADPSGTVPSECNPSSAQYLAWAFGRTVASYALHDPHWRDTLFNEGEYLINGKLTHIWVWDEIWGTTDSRGVPDRLVPLVVGSLLSDCDNSRTWKELREHYIWMWDGSYTSYGKPLSEISPQDDLYWAIRIGFVDRMIEYEKSAEGKSDLPTEIATIRDILTGIALRQEKAHRESEQKLNEILASLPSTPESTRSRLKKHFADMVGLLPENVFKYCVEGELFYDSRTKQSQAILSFAKAVEACLNYCLVKPLTSYIEKSGGRLEVCLTLPRGTKTETIKALDKFNIGRFSLADWASILETLSIPRGKSLSDLGVGTLREFVEEHLGGTRLPDFRPILEPLRRIQKCRNNAAHDSPDWESYQQDLEQTRSIVMGIGGQPSVLTLIVKLLAPGGPADLESTSRN